QQQQGIAGRGPYERPVTLLRTDGRNHAENKYERRRFTRSKAKGSPAKEWNAQKCPWMVAHLLVKNGSKHHSGGQKTQAQQYQRIEPLPYNPSRLWVRDPQ